MLLLLAALAGSSFAVPPEVAPFAGVAWRPLSRQDLVWVDEERTSGTGVGEFDGAVRPVIDGFLGIWIARHYGIVLGVGAARVQTTTWVDDTYQQRAWGVVRPSLEFRYAPLAIRDRFPVPWLMIGVHGDIPAVSDRSDGYTAEQQDAADETAAEERARLGGVGGRTGVGVDYRLLPGIAVGAMFSVGLQRSVLKGTDATFVSSWVSTEGALLLTFEWPIRRDDE